MRSPRRSTAARPPAVRASVRLSWSLLILWAMPLAGGRSPAAEWPAIRPQFLGRTPPTARPRISPTDKLEQTWPGYPEGLAMLVEVLSGQPPGPEAGWYRKGQTQRRFDWPAARDRLDRNRDGRIVREEWGGSDADFRRLDRNRDGRLDAPDFEFATYGRPGSSGDDSFALNAFASADRDFDGRLRRDEWEGMLKQAFSDPIIREILAKIRNEIDVRLKAAEKAGDGFLALSDFQEAFSLTPRPEILAMMAGPHPAPLKSASRRALFWAFVRGDLGSMGAGPAFDAPAPDFTLPTADGRTRVTLSKLLDTKPVVLIFGNFTCGPFRNHAGSLELLRKRHGDLAHFVVVYTREAHPSDGWQLEENLQAKVILRQPRDLRERTGAALGCRRSLDLEMPMLIDTMDDRVATLYSALPSRLYLIDRGGRIAYKGGRGPYGFKPAELEQSLILLPETDRTTEGPGVRK